MMFEKPLSLPILPCSSCNSTGLKNWSRCAVCQGTALGWFIRGKWLYWYYPLTRYQLALRHITRIFNKIRFFSSLVLGLNAWIWAGFLIYRYHAFADFITRIQGYSAISLSAAYYLIPNSIRLLTWLGIIFFGYTYYRSIRERKVIGMAEQYRYADKSEDQNDLTQSLSWDEVRKISYRNRINIANSFTDEALGVLDQAFQITDQLHQDEIFPEHVL
jgi:hypothetical protein